jgi:hypothetical protein
MRKQCGLKAAQFRRRLGDVMKERPIQKELSWLSSQVTLLQLQLSLALLELRRPPQQQRPANDNYAA